ncbi:MAG: AMP-binding protein [Acidimicrobiales bacterium]|nr:AMP-binding protein [Acidimicrobiales bacterium]
MGVLVGLEAQGARFVDDLRRAWNRGDAVLPIDPRLPAAAQERLVNTLRVGEAVEDGVALVVSTSGTTGEPKGVVLTHDHVAASAEATSARLGIDPEHHRWLACLPLAHVGGLSVVTRALHTGAGLTVHDRFDADAVDHAAHDGCTHVSLVATAMARIDTTRWDLIVLGGSAPPPDRPSNSVATYGMTETGSGVVYDGVPLPGVEVTTSNGELWLRGPMIAEHYRDGTRVVDDEGWLHTDDLGTVADGLVDVEGRRGDLIITGGENVHPDPVERRLRAHPGIVDAAVVGRADPAWGQRVVAVVELTDPAAAPPSVDELGDWIRAALPSWAAPKEVEIRDVLPRTTLGKVRRTELR